MLPNLYFAFGAPAVNLALIFVHIRTQAHISNYVIRKVITMQLIAM